MSFCIDDEKLLEKYKVIWTKIENLKNIELNDLPVSDDRYIKIKIRTCGDKVYTNFPARRWYRMWIFYSYFYLFFSCIQKKYYLQVYLDNCSCKIANRNRQIILMAIFLKIRSYKCCITLELI